MMVNLFFGGFIVAYARVAMYLILGLFVVVDRIGPL